MFVVAQRTPKRTTIAPGAHATIGCTIERGTSALTDSDRKREQNRIVRIKVVTISVTLPARSPRAQTRTTPSPDSDTVTVSDGVSDPPDRGGAIGSARTGVAHAIVPAVTLTGAAPRAAKDAARYRGPRRTSHQRNIRWFNGFGGRVSRYAAASTVLWTKHADKVPFGGQPLFRGRPPGRPLLFVDQATSTRGERCRYCRESSTHSTRPSSRSTASLSTVLPAIQSVFAGSSSHCR